MNKLNLFWESSIYACVLTSLTQDNVYMMWKTKQKLKEVIIILAAESVHGTNLSPAQHVEPPNKVCATGGQSTLQPCSQGLSFSWVNNAGQTLNIDFQFFKLGLNWQSASYHGMFSAQKRAWMQYNVKLSQIP